VPDTSGRATSPFELLLRLRIYEYAVILIATYVGLIALAWSGPFASIGIALFIAGMFFVVFGYGALACLLQYVLIRLNLKTPTLLSVTSALVFFAEGFWVISTWSNPLPKRPLLLALVAAAALGVFAVNLLVLQNRPPPWRRA
jgi:hypothetical protein